MGESFKDRMKRLRLRAGFPTHAAAAKAIGCDRGTVSMWEAPSSNVRSVSGDNLLRAAAAYRVSPEYINSGEGQDGFPLGGVAEPVAASDATLTHPSQARYRRVLVRGVAMVDAAGFWQELEQSKGDEYIEVATSDPDAYAVRIVGRRYYPVIDSGQCVLLSPAAPLKMSRRVLVRLADGRHTVRLYLHHQDGLWMFASLTDANDVLELRDEQVTAVERVMAVSDSE